MNIFEQLRSGADVNMATPEYAEAIKHMTDCATICFKINTTAPMPEQIRPLEEELFKGGLDATSYLMPPLQIDFACQMKIGRGVFVNHSLTCMAGRHHHRRWRDDRSQRAHRHRQPRLPETYGAALQARPHLSQCLDRRRCHHPAWCDHRRECRSSCRCRCHKGRCSKHHRRWQSRQIHQEHLNSSNNSSR